MKRPDRLEGESNFSPNVPLGIRLTPTTLAGLRNLAEKLREDALLKGYRDLAMVGQEAMVNGGGGITFPSSRRWRKAYRNDRLR